MRPFRHPLDHSLTLWPHSLSVLVETVSKKPIAPHVKDIVFEMMVDDDEGEDVEVSSLHSELRTYLLTVPAPGPLPQGSPRRVRLQFAMLTLVPARRFASDRALVVSVSVHVPCFSYPRRIPSST